MFQQRKVQKCNPVYTKISLGDGETTSKADSVFKIRPSELAARSSPRPVR